VVPSPLPSATPAPTTAAATPPPAGAPTADPALAAILSYLEARTRADVEAAADLSCAAWRSQAVTEAISFRSMNARMEGVVCALAGTDGPFTLVTCDGTLVTTYGTETRERDMSHLVYRAAPEDGAWRMCGYQ
jgi:hypothetical protein